MPPDCVRRPVHRPFGDKDATEFQRNEPYEVTGIGALRLGAGVAACIYQNKEPEKYDDWVLSLDIIGPLPPCLAVGITNEDTAPIVEGIACGIGMGVGAVVYGMSIDIYGSYRVHCPAERVTLGRCIGEGATCTSGEFVMIEGKDVRWQAPARLP